MTLVIPDYIEKLPDYLVDVTKLVAEFKTIEHLLVSPPRYGSIVTTSKTLSLVVSKQNQQVLNSLLYTNEVITYLRKTYDFNTVTYRSIMPNACYPWHADLGGICLNIPLITNPGCHFVYEGHSFHMPADGSVYVVNQKKPHTFVNSGGPHRLHITIENFITRPAR